MKKDAFHQIYRFQLQGKTRRTAITIKKRKTTTVIEEKITAATEIATAIKTVFATGGVFKTFRKEAATTIKVVIIARKQIITTVIRASEKSIIISFNKTEKYI